MRTAEEILSKYLIENWAEDSINGGTEKMDVVTVYDAQIAMKEYAKEVLRDYDNWKAHKTPDLVELYIKEKGI